jgi:hypothetical protein
VSDRAQATLAYVTAAVHIIAAVAMLVVLRYGLPGYSTEERLLFIHSHQAAWRGAWLLWHIAAMLVVALFVVLALRYRAWAAIIVSLAAIAIDLTSEQQYMRVLPLLGGGAFVTLDRRLDVLIGGAANGGYTLALALIAIAGWRDLPPAIATMVFPIVTAGAALVVASLLHSALGATIASALLFPLFTIWMLMVGRWLYKRSA